MNIKHNDEIFSFLRKQELGATISEIVKNTHLSRDNVRIALAALEGAGKILCRDVGKAKLYLHNERRLVK